MSLKIVTISGADDTVDPIDLANLSAKYPFVEWGILASKTRLGTLRYPSNEWLQELSKHSNNLNISTHLCGEFASNLIERGELSLNAFSDALGGLVSSSKRIQINYKTEKLSGISEEFSNFLRLLYKKQIIIQASSFSFPCLNEILAIKPDSAILFDKSGGRGVTCVDWPEPHPNIFCGFAGGLGPDNVEEALSKITEFNRDVWIDMESNIRTNDAFDLEKVEHVLSSSMSYISLDSWHKALLSTGSIKP